jgi:hypothetical protein
MTEHEKGQFSKEKVHFCHGNPVFFAIFPTKIDFSNGETDFLVFSHSC